MSGQGLKGGQDTAPKQEVGVIEDIEPKDAKIKGKEFFTTPLKFKTYIDGLLDESGRPKSVEACERLAGVVKQTYNGKGIPPKNPEQRERAFDTLLDTVRPDKGDMPPENLRLAAIKVLSQLGPHLVYAEPEILANKLVDAATQKLVLGDEEFEKSEEVIKASMLGLERVYEIAYGNYGNKMVDGVLLRNTKSSVKGIRKQAVSTLINIKDQTNRPDHIAGLVRSSMTPDELNPEFIKAGMKYLIDKAGLGELLYDDTETPEKKIEALAKILTRQVEIIKTQQDSTD